VPAGKCATIYCVGSNCNQAKLYDGAITGLSSSDSSDGVSTFPTSDTGLSESQRNFEKVLAEAEQQKNTELSRKIDDAFNDIGALQYKKDLNGIPDVTQPVNPELAEELDKIAHNEQAVEIHEKTDVSSETRNSQLYRDMIARSEDVIALSPQQYADDWGAGGFDTFPLTDTASVPQGALMQPTLEAPGTFADAQGHFWNGWRLSENVEKQSWGNYIASHAIVAGSNVTYWIASTPVMLYEKIKGLFVR
jgi:hypothetical protein